MKRGKEELSFYDKLVASDILTPIERHLQTGRLHLSSEGIVTEKRRVDFERPWLTPVVDKERNCSKWFAIYFKIYQIIPRGCRNCWKVAFHPKTLEDMFRVVEIQDEMGIPSKSGLEKRGRTGRKGGYSSFWYGPLAGGLSRGKWIFGEVEKTLKERLGYSDGLILKRGCTEMEQFSQNIFGSSAVWDSRAEAFDATERLLDTVFDIPEFEDNQLSQLCENYVQRSWIEWAFEHGDETYLRFTDGRPLVPEPFNYAMKENLKVWIPNTWEGGKDEGADPVAAIEPIV